MKETKQAPATPEARAAMHEMMAAFEAFKGANDARLDEIERKASADTLLEEKVARIDQAVASAQARLDRVVSEGRRPALGVRGRRPLPAACGPPPHWAWGGEGGVRRLSEDAAQSFGLELKAGLSTASNSAGYVVPEQTERAIERRLMAGSPMREIATVRTVASAGVFRKPVSTAGVVVGLGGRDGGATRDGSGHPGPAGVPVGRSLRLPGGDPVAAGRRPDRPGRMAGRGGRGRLRRAGDHGLRQRRRDQQAERGFLSYTTVADAGHDWGKIGYVASGAAGAFAGSSPADRLIDLVYAPKAQYRPNGRFVMNRKTVSAVRKFKDADGNYIWQPAQRAGETASLLGYPVTEIETMPDIAANSLRPSRSATSSAAI
jgi:predicted phage gp36 major capsid-like protein